MVSPTEWDRFVSEQPRAHILQLAHWAELKQAYGWSYERILLKDAPPEAGAQLLFRRLPFNVGTMAYLSMGPYPTASEDKRLWEAIHATARRHRAIFLKWEPGLFESGDPLPDFEALGFHESSQTVQPPRTILIDIRDSEEAILARMNQGTRRKIRQSGKHDIRYYEATPEDVRKFTDLMTVTGSRNEFGVHEAGYYQLAYSLFVPQHAALIMAEHEGDTLAGVMVFAVGDSTWYLYGASGDIKRNMMASYGVQWEAIRWAKRRGCTTYDMWGIPDEDEAVLEAGFEQRSDGLWGVYGFKRGWGGRVVRSAGAWDYVYQPLLYRAYQMALGLRR